MGNKLQSLAASSVRVLGLNLAVAGLIPLVFACAGAIFAIMFPKYEAEGLLVFPGAATLSPEGVAPVELAEFRRVMSAYGSRDMLSAYIVAGGNADSATERLMSQTEKPGFWSSAIEPQLPYGKRDQKEFGEIRDAATTQLVGVNIAVNAGQPDTANRMHALLAGYLRDAILHERARGWILRAKADALSSEAKVAAEISRLENDNALAEIRAADMRAIIARYPDARSMDSRQLVPISSGDAKAADASERFLSPLAQLVGAESAISQRKEQIRRLQRDLKQKQLLAPFFVKAEKHLAANVYADRFVDACASDLKALLDSEVRSEEWAREAIARTQTQLFVLSAQSQVMSVRGGAVVSRIESREPARAALYGLLLAVAALTAIGLARLSWKEERTE